MTELKKRAFAEISIGVFAENGLADVGVYLKRKCYNVSNQLGSDYRSFRKHKNPRTVSGAGAFGT
jgi:hypothetical protein